MTDYSDKMIDRIIHLWNVELYTAGDIGIELGVSRSAIIGKVRRLLETGKFIESEARIRANIAPSERIRPPVRIPASKSASVPAAPAPSTYVPKAEALAPIRHVSMEHLGRHDCKWPIGDPSAETFSFCGRRAETNRPYCTEHLRVARPVGNPTPKVTEAPGKRGHSFKYTPRFFTNERK